MRRIHVFTSFALFGALCAPALLMSSCGDSSEDLTCEMEIDTSSDVSNCGECGLVCSDENASAACVAGQCEIACTQGYGDCNADAADGCEADTVSNVDSCGSCDNDCNALNAEVTCVQSDCVMGACIAPWEDQNEDEVDGCESHIGTCATGVDELIGITWNGGNLIAFDPCSGEITQNYTQVAGGSFRGLTYDPTNDVLYASTQGAKNLYSIDPDNLQVALIGSMDTPGDISSITYDSDTNTLYAAAVGIEEESQLFTVNPADASVALVGTLPAMFIDSISYSDQDQQIYAYATYGSGSWDSPFKSSLVSIDPSTAAMTLLFETPYHTTMGLAKKPGESVFFTWVNWTAHSYARIDVAAEIVSLVSNSDTVKVSSDAMIYKSFSVNGQ